MQQIQINNKTIGKVETNTNASGHFSMQIPKGKYSVEIENKIDSQLRQFMKTGKYNFIIYQSDFLSNEWGKNYWGKPRIIPKIIPGNIDFKSPLNFRWMYIDWHPAQEPYEI